MRLSTAFLTLSAVATANAIAADTDAYVNLTIESSNERINGLRVSYGEELRKLQRIVSLSDPSSSANYEFNIRTDGSLGWSGYTLNVLHNTLELTFLGQPGALALITDNYLTVNGSNGVFYACTPPPETVDPASLPVKQELRGIGVFSNSEAVPSQCEPVKIKAISATDPDSSESPAAATTTTTSTDAAGTPAPWASLETSAAAAAAAAAATTTTATTSPSSSHTPSNNVPVTAQAYPSSSAFDNKTTNSATAANYTTIACPSPTTFSYGGKTYTVSSATTLTIEDCSCTDTPEAPAVVSATSPPSIPVVNSASGLRIGLLTVIIAIAGSLIF